MVQAYDKIFRNHYQPHSIASWTIKSQKDSMGRTVANNHEAREVIDDKETVRHRTQHRTMDHH